MQEFFEVVTLEQALALAAQFRPVASESVPLLAGQGRVLAEAVQAPADAPEFARATMDGFAVRASSTYGASDGSPALLAVVGAVAMGEAARVKVGPGQAARIGTGGMLPEGADAVLMVEHTEPIDEQSIEGYRTVAPGQHVVQRGEDWQRGEQLIQTGTRLRPQEIGLLAALGRSQLTVFARPRVGIISTGDEVVPLEQTPGLGQIRDVNSYTLAAWTERLGAQPALYGIVPDDFEALRRASEQALHESDLVLLSGGSSVGARDFTIDTIQALPDSEVLVHGISIKPGKPTILARVGSKAFFGLPGHVTSAMVVFHTMVGPVLRQVAGERAPSAAQRPARARLGRKVASVHGRVDYVRVRLREEQGALWADPVLGPSGLLRTMLEAEGLVQIDLNAEGLDEGADVWVTPL